MNDNKNILPDTVDALKEFIFTLQSEKTKIESENKILHDKLSGTESECRILNDKLSGTESECRILNDKLTGTESECRILNNKLSETESEYRILAEKYKAALARFFSPTKDKVTFENSDQLSLFNEAETHAEKENTELSEASDADTTNEILVKSHARKKGGKRRIPDTIPAEEIIHELSDAGKSCECCGKARPVIGEDRSEELDIIPAQIKKIVHVVKKYGPCSCDDFLHTGKSEVIRAAKPERIIPYSIVSAGLLAYCIDYKYNYAMPYYRLSKKFEALEIDISRATLCNWTMIAAEKCRVMYDLMRAYIIRSSIINMDETRVQVLKEDGKTAESESYMWVMKGGNNKKKLTVFHYDPSRSSLIPVKLLAGFKGYLQTDGYEGYAKAVRDFDLIHVGCLAHVRRKFVDAHKTNKESKTAKAGVLYIAKIYSIENTLRKIDKITPEDFVRRRKEAMQPVLDEFKHWLDEKSITVLPSTEPGKAVSYALNQWDKVIRFLDHADLTPDNNSIENAIRPFAVGRKNWLFSNTPRGAESSAIMYSLVESAKNNNLNVYNYLRYLFTKLPEAKSPEELGKLLPCNLLPADVTIS